MCRWNPGPQPPVSLLPQPPKEITTMLTDNSGCPLVPTAKITVGNLQQNGDGICNNPDFSLANSAECEPKVCMKGNGLDIEITVTGEVDLQFEVAPTERKDKKRRPVPISISFEEEPASNANQQEKNCDEEAELLDPLGLKAFPDRHFVSVNGTTVLVVRDKCAVEGCFKFTLAIQKPGVKKSIIIDPKIRNVPM
jgi:hypothetical protein